jgi:hypothetical protein
LDAAFTPDGLVQVHRRAASDHEDLLDTSFCQKPEDVVGSLYHQLQVNFPSPSHLRTAVEHQ